MDKRNVKGAEAGLRSFSEGTSADAYRYLGCHRSRRAGKPAFCFASGRRTPGAYAWRAILTAGPERAADGPQGSRRLGVVFSPSENF